NSAKPPDTIEFCLHIAKRPQIWIGFSDGKHSGVKLADRHRCAVLFALPGEINAGKSQWCIHSLLHARLLPVNPMRHIWPPTLTYCLLHMIHTESEPPANLCPNAASSSSTVR